MLRDVILNHCLGMSDQKSNLNITILIDTKLEIATAIPVANEIQMTQRLRAIITTCYFDLYLGIFKLQLTVQTNVKAAL